MPYRILLVLFLCLPPVHGFRIQSTSRKVRSKSLHVLDGPPASENAGTAWERLRTRFRPCAKRFGSHKAQCARRLAVLRNPGLIPLSPEPQWRVSSDMSNPAAEPDVAVQYFTKEGFPVWFHTGGSELQDLQVLEPEAQWQNYGVCAGSVDPDLPDLIDSVQTDMAKFQPRRSFKERKNWPHYQHQLQAIFSHIESLVQNTLQKVLDITLRAAVYDVGYRTSQRQAGGQTFTPDMHTDDLAGEYYMNHIVDVEGFEIVKLGLAYQEQRCVGSVNVWLLLSETDKQSPLVFPHRDDVSAVRIDNPLGPGEVGVANEVAMDATNTSDQDVLRAYETTSKLFQKPRLLKLKSMRRGQWYMFPTWTAEFRLGPRKIELQAAVHAGALTPYNSWNWRKVGHRSSFNQSWWLMAGDHEEAKEAQEAGSEGGGAPDLRQWAPTPAERRIPQRRSLEFRVGLYVD